MPDVAVFVVSTDTSWSEPLRAVGPRQVHNDLHQRGYDVHEISYPLADRGRVCGAYDAAALLPFDHVGDLLVGFGVGAAMFDHPLRLVVLDPEAEAPGLAQLDSDLIVMLSARMRGVNRLVSVGADLSGLSALDLGELEPVLVQSSAELVDEIDKTLR